MEELTATVQQNAANARQANDSTGASQAAGTPARWWARWRSWGIDASARKIVDIIGVIDGIASQTNILAPERGRGGCPRG